MPNPAPGTSPYIYASVNSILGYSIDPVIFNAFIATAQVNRELMREWMSLKKKDASQTAAPSDTFLTAKTIPADLLKYVEKDPIQLVDSVTNPQLINYYTERPMELQNEIKDDFGAFYADYANSQFYLCGKSDRNYTIQQFYIRKPADVYYDTTGAANVSWAFPAWCSNILIFDVAAMQRLGADYDDLNARMGDENAQRAEITFAAMVKWDARISKGSVQNMPIPARNGASNFRSRAVNIDGE